MIQKHRKNGNLYLFIGFLMMAILFYSSSQTYEQQSQLGLLSKLLKNEPFKEQLSSISFLYAGSEVSIAQSGYFSFIEFFIRKGAHFGTYFILGSSFFLGLRRQSSAASSAISSIPCWSGASIEWLIRREAIWNSSG